MPLFVTLYDVMSGQGTSCTHDDVKMIFPLIPRSTITRAEAWATRNALFKFRSIILSQSSSEY